MLALTWLVYQPGLRGGFLFDDFNTLPKLAERGDMRTPRDVARFVFSGIAGPTGRPVALGSFLLDDSGWPSQPERFKRTNLLLHLLCGLLTAWLARLCCQSLRLPADRTAWATAIAGALWLLHPLFVSTTLYVVQRMTILSAMFVLWGLCLHVRQRLALSQSSAAPRLLAVMTIQLSAFTLLALLSKENGALLPVLALVLEVTVLAGLGPGPNPALFRAWRILVLGLPFALVMAYLGYSALHFAPTDEAYRGFTIGERLLTEGRVLVDYLHQLCIPRLEPGGLYHDDFVASAGWLTPPTTLISVAVVFALIGLAWQQRRQSPLLACAILFFFAGHLLESTTVPLELYFEHRNYLPSVFLAIAGGTALSGIRANSYRAVASAGLIAIFAFLTWQRAMLWGDTDAMLLFWAQQQPRSERTQLQAAEVHLKHGAPQLAMSDLNQGLSSHPDSVALLALKIDTRCGLGGDVRNDFEQTLHAIQFSPYGPSTYAAIDFLFASSNLHRCVTSAQGWQRIAQALINNATVRASASALQQARFFEGLAHLRAGSSADAYTAFSRALESRYDYSAGMRMAAELASAGAPDCALALLDVVERADRDARPPAGLASYLADEHEAGSEHRREITELRLQIEHDLADARAASQCGPR